MIKVKYPSNLDKLRENYLLVFPCFQDLEKRWNHFKCKIAVELKKLLTADFDELVDYYYLFRDVEGKLTDADINELKSIFDYDAMQSKIAAFFMDSDNGFHLTTCHYCNMAYINSYGKNDSYDNVFDFVNKATRAEWRKIFNKDQLSEANLVRILNDRPFARMADFNKPAVGGKYLNKRIESYNVMKLKANANHFDLDHLLPKSKCPIIALSLFNFVPSCQVCNEKLKGDMELASTKEDWLKISPTYKDSTLSDDVIVKLIPKSSCSTFFELEKAKENYYLHFETLGENVYDDFVFSFRLQDRYNYHKSIALQILSLKERYGEEKRKELSRILSAKFDDKVEGIYSESQIYEDLFHEDLNKERCFSKLYYDMIHKN